MNEHSEITIEEGSTNVYADLGYTDAAEMQRKSQLAGEIARAIKARRLTQEDAAALLGMQDEMTGDELDELEKMIAKARDGRMK